MWGKAVQTREVLDVSGGRREAGTEPGAPGDRPQTGQIGWVLDICLDLDLIKPPSKWPLARGAPQWVHLLEYACSMIAMMIVNEFEIVV